MPLSALDKVKLELANTFASVDAVNQLVRQYIDAVQSAKTNEDVANLKIDLADEILSLYMKVDESYLITIVSVKFSSGNRIYDYIWDGATIPQVDDTVAVKSNWSQEDVYTTVVAVRQCKESELDPNIDYKHAHEA